MDPAFTTATSDGATIQKYSENHDGINSPSFPVRRSGVGSEGRLQTQKVEPSDITAENGASCIKAARHQQGWRKIVRNFTPS